MVDFTELQTDRLLLRRFRPDDVDDALAYRDDTEFSRYLPHIPQPFTRRDAEEWVARNIEEPWDLFPTIAIVLDGRVIGTVNFDVDPSQQVAMLGFAIGHLHWGKGIATEAARAAVDWAFEAFGLAKIWATSDARHVGSQRVMEKLGMQREGLLRSHELARDGRTDKVYYGLLREEWSARRRISMPTDRMDIDVALVRRLIGSQFPRWAELPIRPCEPGGWDNRTFHLGDQMTVRLPSAERYVAQVQKEHQWLPKLAPLLPLPIPVPLALGAPHRDYPWPWSVYRWLKGDTASPERVVDMPRFAVELAQFLIALQRIDVTGGPPPGSHNFCRGGPLATYDRETRQAIETLDDELDTAAATAVWEAGLATTWSRAPVWVHGDFAAGNVLVERGRLSAVIDFGCCGVGDPACDLTIAWGLLDGESRQAFRAALPLDRATWARGRGWALWKALIVWIAHLDHSIEAPTARRIVDDVLADHRREGQGETDRSLSG